VSAGLERFKEEREVTDKEKEPGQRLKRIENPVKQEDRKGGEEDAQEAGTCSKREKARNAIGTQ